jgi:hypothetical protein
MAKQDKQNKIDFNKLARPVSGDFYAPKPDPKTTEQTIKEKIESGMSMVGFLLWAVVILVTLGMSLRGCGPYIACMVDDHCTIELTPHGNN